MSEQADKRFDGGLATAFSMGPVILTITRLADGRFVEVNERFLTVTLQPHESGRYFGDLTNVRLDACNRFLISVESTLPRPQVVQEFVRRAKVASHDDMDIVVSTSVGGINMSESRDPPPELPVKPGLVYFDLPSRGNDVYWKHVVNDRNLVVWLPPTLDHDKPTVKLLGTFIARNA